MPPRMPRARSRRHGKKCYQRRSFTRNESQPPDSNPQPPGSNERIKSRIRHLCHLSVARAPIHHSGCFVSVLSQAAAAAAAVEAAEALAASERAASEAASETDAARGEARSLAAQLAERDAALADAHAELAAAETRLAELGVAKGGGSIGGGSISRRPIAEGTPAVAGAAGATGSALPSGEGGFETPELAAAVRWHAPGFEPPTPSAGADGGETPLAEMLADWTIESAKSESVKPLLTHLYPPSTPPLPHLYPPSNPPLTPL